MNKTTAHKLNDRAEKYVASCDDNDPVKKANLLIDLANIAVNDGRFDDADDLFNQAEDLLK